MSQWRKASGDDYARKNSHLAAVDQRQKPSASTIFIDPLMAQRVLAKNTRNRPISEAHVQRLTDEMVAGRWKYNGEAIKWSIDDELLDGQHRLTALSRLPEDFPAIPFLVVRGLPASVQDTMDQGRTRTAGDQLVIDGLVGGSSGSRVIAGAIRVHIEWKRMAFFGQRMQANQVSNPEVVEWAQSHPIEMSIMQDISGDRLRRVKARPSVTLAALLHFRLIDGDDARDFAEALVTGAGLDVGNPILALRDRLDRIKEQKLRVSDRDLIGYFIMAWNAWRQGRSLNKLQMPKGGAWTRDSFPEAI